MSGLPFRRWATILYRVRIAHLADPHLGIRQYHRQTAAGINQREHDVANAFRAAVDGVITEQPELVIVAGDLFHSVRPGNASIIFAFRQFQRLLSALPETPVVLIAGNHDTPRSAETGSIFGLFEDMGVRVAATDARRFEFPELDLSLLAVPHQALVGGERPALRPEGSARRQVLVLHGDIEGVIPATPGVQEYGGAVVTPAELGADQWSYVALGHYHVQREVAPRSWYAGSLDYVSSNPWGELREERSRNIAGKGWLLVDPDSGAVERRLLPSPRRFLDLEPIAGMGLSPAELDVAIAERLGTVPGGLAASVVRLVVRDVPRHVARSLDHSAMRALRADALHLQLDIRRPEVTREVGMGAPGRRQTLPGLVENYLEKRPLPAELDRREFVALGVELVETAERELASG
ncbi:MAG TPA: DNA repair exonuclease [Gemmatimonadales bacterium]|nr:DNA repair exonuclease [Gemmatimonadales bacterium]